MRPNLRIGLLLSNHHPEVADGLALELIVGAMKDARDQVPGEVIVAIYTPEDSVWVFSLGGGVWELRQSPEGKNLPLHEVPTHRPIFLVYKARQQLIK